jgi:hypothetical protein
MDRALPLINEPCNRQVSWGVRRACPCPSAPYDVNIAPTLPKLARDLSRATFDLPAARKQIYDLADESMSPGVLSELEH